MIPVSFEGCAGYYHPARGARGVVICGSFGFEEICARKSVALLAHELAARGVNVLRFDYFGTGDSLGGPLNPGQVATWIDNIRAAAGWLRAHGGVSDISLLGLRLGALLAVNAATAIEDVSTLALIAPPASGKAWLRESLAFSSMVAPPAGAADRAGNEDGDIVIAGYRLTAETAADLNSLDWRKLTAVTEPSILIMPRERTQEAGKVAALAAGRAAKIETLAFTGYDGMMCDPTASEPPMPTLRLLAERLAAGGRESEGAPAIPPLLPLAGPCFVETPRAAWPPTPISTACSAGLPVGEKRRNIIVFFNAGGIPHTGWGRMHVDIARKLARFGTSSLRIDLPGLGDSARPGGPSTVSIISQDMTAQISAVIDWLKQRGFVEITLAGSCSGAYHAFRTALSDVRVDRLVLLNQVSFVWERHPRDDETIGLAEIQGRARCRRASPRSTVTGASRSGSSQTHGADVFRSPKKFARGSLDAMMTLSAMANSVLAKQNQVEAAFQAIAGRGAKIMLVYSENDAGPGRTRPASGRGWRSCASRRPASIF